MVKRRKKCRVEVGWKELRSRRYQMLGFQMGAVLAGEVLPRKDNTLKKKKNTFIIEFVPPKLTYLSVFKVSLVSYDRTGNLRLKGGCVT